MKTESAFLSISRKRATRARSRIVFFLLRRVLRRMTARPGRPAGRRRRAGIAALAVRHS
jgi:hypothetical protein